MSKRAHLLVGVLVIVLAVLVAGCTESPAEQAEKKADVSVSDTKTAEQSNSEAAPSESKMSQEPSQTKAPTAKDDTENVSANNNVPAANTDMPAKPSDPVSAKGPTRPSGKDEAETPAEPSGASKAESPAEPSEAELSAPSEGSAESDVAEDVKNQVISLIDEFGKKLQSVSLLAPQDVLKKSLEGNYGDLVVPDLVEQWLEDPSGAPGRLASSPWPERIEINNIAKLSDSTYEVEGEIIEITSTEVGSSKVAAKRPITFTVTKSQERWLISSVIVGDYESTEQITYRNDTYGFSFLLPASWQGYKVIENDWGGYGIGDPSNTGITQTGPKISIRHPLWTEDEPRQDIPIMVLTTEQWQAIEREEFHIGAAPIGPRKIGQNAKYVFAIPARYNFGFLTGFEEVEEILASDPLVVEE